MGLKKKTLLCGLTFMFVLLQKIIYCLQENLMSISINQTATIYDKRQQQFTINDNKVAAQLCGLSVGLAIARFQVQCPVPSVVVAVVSLSKELYSHCSSPPSCINGQISPTSTARSSVTFPEGAERGSEKPPRGATVKKNLKKVMAVLVKTCKSCDYISEGD